MLIPLGIDVTSGELLPEAVPGSALASIDEDSEQIKERNEAHLGVTVEDPNDLSQTGWSVLFPGTKDYLEVEKELQPLLALRERQAAPHYRIFKGEEGFQPGDTVEKWLRRRHVDLRTVKPSKGVPYYILIVGSPEEIPFDFQYKLDSYWATGRLYFDHSEDYGAYAKRAVAAEESKASKNVAVVATRHLSDPATQLLHDHLAVPLTTDGEDPPLGEKQGFTLQKLLAQDATRSRILDLLRGTLVGGRPSLLFTGSHGCRFELTDPEIRNRQGAILCADFPQIGTPVDRKFYLAAEDLGDCDLTGMIHFFFACYSAGCPRTDTYFRSNDGAEKQIMPAPIVARLPQALLSRGTLAIIGHIDRVWTYSFKGAGVAQTQEFRDVLDKILRGIRVGQALDEFNRRWAVLSIALSELLNKRQFPGMVRDDELTEKWKERNDARNYIVLGDPAARLNV